MTRTTATAAKDDDIYGHVHPNETPSLIKSSLKELDLELDKLPPDIIQGWKQAQDKCDPKLINNDFKLLFLRCEVFNVELAAARLAAYWNKRIELFGPEKAFLPLTLDGALKDDEAALNVGFARIVPHAKDPDGRGLLYIDPANQDKTLYSRESMVRAWWHVLHAALEDCSVQKVGVVSISNPSRAKLSQLDRTQGKMNVESIKGIVPLRIGAFLKFVIHPAFLLSCFQS